MFLILMGKALPKKQAPQRLCGLFFCKNVNFVNCKFAGISPKRVPHGGRPSPQWGYSRVQGLQNKEIADQLCISVNTVITHRRNIARKLQIHSPAGLTIYAIVNGLVDISSVKL